MLIYCINIDFNILLYYIDINFTIFVNYTIDFTVYLYDINSDFTSIYSFIRFINATVVMLKYHGGFADFLRLGASYHHSCNCLCPSYWPIWCMREFDSTACFCISCQAIGSSAIVEWRMSSCFLMTSALTLCRLLLSILPGFLTILPVCCHTYHCIMTIIISAYSNWLLQGQKKKLFWKQATMGSSIGSAVLRDGHTK